MATDPTPQPNGHLDDRLDSLLHGLDGVHASIDAERDARLRDAQARDEENDSRDHSAFVTKVFAVIACLVGVIGLGVGGIGVTRASKADQKAATAQALAETTLVARTAAQKVTCDQANVQAAKHNTLADTFDQILQIAIAPNPNGPPRTAQEQADTDAFYNDAHDKLVAARDPGRDCTPEGIAAFYYGK